MSLEVKYIWHYKPDSFIEGEHSFKFDGINIEIKDGQITAFLKKEKHDSTPDLYNTLHPVIENILKGFSVSSHSVFKFTKGSIEEENEKGGKNITVFMETGSFSIVGFDVDIKITDSEGNVIEDSKQDRISRHHAFAKLIASSPTDPLLELLIESYQNAINDPEDELVHLYEIAEFLQTKFGGRAEARRIIGVSGTKWSKLARLSNIDPFNQGRHRGKYPKDLRDATDNELNQARRIAREMIEKYAKYIQ